MGDGRRPYVVNPPDVLLIQLLKPAEGQPATIVDGPHLVRPDSPHEPGPR